MKLKRFDVDWAEEFNGSITVCDTNGIIVYMNKYSVNQFEKYGGEKLLGTNLLNCHPEPFKTKLTEMLEHPFDNMYTTENGNVKTIIYQTVWTEKGDFKGIIEISFRLDKNMPHFVRS